jgi:hypothetical protein
MCLPFLNLSVRYDALLHGWCVAYVGDSQYIVIISIVSTTEELLDRKIAAPV